MRHNDTVQSEFTRQAETFRASPTLRAAEITTRVGEALGTDRRRVLDVACGPGLLLPSLADRAESVFGVDLTRKNLELAREAETRSPVHLVRGLAEQLPFAARAFDAVVLRLALHHFVRPEAVLEAARSLLAPAGRLIVLDVLGPEEPEAQELRDAIERLRDPSHTALLSGAWLRTELGRDGFVLREEDLWSQRREFGEWAHIMNEPQRMADLERILRALAGTGTDPAALEIREEEGGELCFTYDWGLFVAERPSA